VDPRINLRQRGATAEECAYLVRQGGVIGAGAASGSNSTP
jgi:hypothetical protein